MAQVLPSLAQAEHSVLAHSLPAEQVPQQEDLPVEQEAKAKATPADMRMRNFFIGMGFNDKSIRPMEIFPHFLKMFNFFDGK